jgi:hypothetical protein
MDQYYESRLRSADLWLTWKSVEGFDPVDFTDWPAEDRTSLAHAIERFFSIAKSVPANEPASASQRKEARQHLEHAVEIVGRHVRDEWLAAQDQMMNEAAEAAESQGWHVEKDQKKVHETLLGDYKAPRLFITTRKKQEVVLDPIARFGSGRQGIVDLAVMPRFETIYLVTFKNGAWSIVSRSKSQHRRPFSQATLVNTITGLPAD